MATAMPIVATARFTPRVRNEGRATRSPTGMVASTPITSASSKLMPQL